LKTAVEQIIKRQVGEKFDSESPSNVGIFLKNEKCFN